MGNPPSEMVDHAVNDEIGNGLVDKVFGNHVLGDIIFRYALGYNLAKDYKDFIYRRDYGYPEVCGRKDLCNFRLVSKLWREVVSQFLERKKEPLYVVKMTEENSLKKSPEVRANGKVLENFLHFLKSREQKDSYAGFCLKMQEPVFRFENHKHLSSCLRQLGQHLVEMRLKVPKNGGTFPGQLIKCLELVQLRKLRLSLTDPYDPRWLSKAERLAKHKHTPNVMLLIQSLLEKSDKTLKHLHFDNEWIPPEFQYAKLPATLVTLKLLNSSTNRRLLECLTRNHLPELKELTLYFSNGHLYPEKDLIFQVFDKLRHGLRALSIIDETSGEGPLKLRFPVMENLEQLCIDGSDYELKMAPSLSFFPKLTHVELRSVDEKIVKQFSSTLPLVTTLEIEMADYRIGGVMEIVHRACPNLTDLSICCKDDDAAFSNFQYVFREMQQLKRLSLSMYLYGDDEFTSDHWDSLLIGAPLEFVKGLKTTPRSFWKDLKMDNRTGNSISMLKNLTYFRMCAPNPIPPTNTEDVTPLLSEIVFVYAFNGMAKLEHVKLAGRFSFQISKETMEEWEQDGRKIENDPM